jgi:hypothetical protein
MAFSFLHTLFLQLFFLMNWAFNLSLPTSERAFEVCKVWSKKSNHFWDATLSILVANFQHRYSTMEIVDSSETLVYKTTLCHIPIGGNLRLIFCLYVSHRRSNFIDIVNRVYVCYTARQIYLARIF